MLIHNEKDRNYVCGFWVVSLERTTKEHPRLVGHGGHVSELYVASSAVDPGPLGPSVPGAEWLDWPW